MKTTSAVLLLAVLALTPACKEKVIDTSHLSPRTPVAAPHTSPVTTQTSPTVTHQQALAALGPIDEPDAKAPRRRSPAAPAAKLDAMSDEQKAAMARAATERAVSAAIGARVAQLRRCYEATSTAAASVKVSLRVHRRGYVLDATVTGCNDQARSCMTALLKQVRVTGMQTDTVTVQRTFNFRERKVIHVVK